MATETVYVDPVFGNDGTGTVDDPDLPFEHIQAAVDALTIGSDGIAVLAAGVYIEDSGGTNYCDLTRSLTSLTITPTTDYGATIRAAIAGGEARVINATAPLTLFSLGKVIIDAENDQTAHITFDATTAMAAVIDGSRFINCDNIVFDSTDYLSSFYMQGDWEVIDAPRVLISSVIESDAVVSISNGSILNDGVNFAQAPIFVSASSTGLSIIIDDLDVYYTCASDATVHRYIIRLQGADTISIKNSAFVFDDNGSTATASTCLIFPDTSITSSSVIIEDNVIGDYQLSTMTNGIIVGGSTALNRDKIDGVVIQNNEIINTLNAILFRFISNARSQANYIQYVDVGCLALATVSCEHTCNLILDASEQSLLAQYDTNSIVANNTCVALFVTPTAHFYSTYNSLMGIDDSHGTFFVNNIILDFIGDELLFFCETSSTAKYKNNDMYQPNGNTVVRFSYNGVTTDSLTVLAMVVNGMNPGYMSGNLEIDPKFDPHEIYELLSTSPLIGAGLKWWTSQDSDPVGINGNSFWDAFVDLGANSTWDGDTRRVPSPERFASPGRSTSYRTPYIP